MWCTLLRCIKEQRPQAACLLGMAARREPVPRRKCSGLVYSNGNSRAKSQAGPRLSVCCCNGGQWLMQTPDFKKPFRCFFFFLKVVAVELLHLTFSLFLAL